TGAADKPVPARRGETVRLTLFGTVQEGYHTYPFVKGTGEFLSRITYKAPEGIIPLLPLAESEPTFDPKAKVLVFEHTFFVSQDILVMPDVKPGKYNLLVTVSTQVCDESKCNPTTVKVPVELEVSSETPV